MRPDASGDCQWKSAPTRLSNGERVKPMHPSSCFTARLNRSAKGRNSLFQGSAQSDLTRVRVYRGFIYGCRCSVTLRYQSKSKIAASAAFHGLIDPYHSERLKQPCVLQWSGIDWLEAELADQLQDHRFFGPIVTCHQHERLHRIVGGIAHIACARRVERLEDESARCPACDLLASRGVESENEL